MSAVIASPADPTANLDSDAVSRLASFSIKLDKGFKTLKQKAADLNGIALFIVGEGKRIESLEQIKWVELDFNFQLHSNCGE